MRMHEVHIQANRAARLARMLPDLRLNSRCDPRGIPPGTLCYEYPQGREVEFNILADALDISYAWGIGNFRGLASAIANSTVYNLIAPDNGLEIIDVTDPANMVGLVTYDLNVVFAVSQVFPSALTTEPSTNRVYVVNADDSVVPVAVSFFVVYDVSDPLVVLQEGSINLGVPTAARAFDGNSLVASGTTVWSLLGGDSTANAAQLRKIDASNPAAPVVATGPVAVGTFADQPRKLALSADGSLLYVLSGTPAVANQTVFVFNSATLALVATLAISDAAALVGLANFFVRGGYLYMIAGDGSASDTNLVIYDVNGIFVSATTVTVGPSGLAIAGPA